MFGASGTIGHAVVMQALADGDEVVAVVRRRPDDPAYVGATIRVVDFSNPQSLADCFRGEEFSAVISCLASRTGVPADARAVDLDANMRVLAAAQATGVPHFVLLSAICVQKPLLAFQYAKLAFEAALVASGLRWSIVRPTAYFKSLSGQVARVAAGKPYLMFGDGRLTACAPISDRDLARYILDCIDKPGRWDRILPIGGPAPARSPREQGEALFALVGRPPRFRRVPVRLLDGIIAVLSALGRVVPALAAKAELARIGRYYATESMLVWDPAAQRYDGEATPSFGGDRLEDYWAALLSGEVRDDRGTHAVY